MDTITRKDPGSGGYLREIFCLLRAAHGVDFAGYRLSTIRRRINRRMVLRHIDSPADYLKLVRSDREELESLYEDLLITVTAFFRDPEVFEFLKTHIIPKILKHLEPDTPARVWVPGCSSGEEAYSIAMCFVEAAPDRIPPVRVFGTDLSNRCIMRARKGLYSEKIKAAVSATRLKRFFLKEAKGYRISKWIRQMCVFAEQNVISDAPLSKMDLVSCRNLLIYLDAPMQRAVLSKLYYALKPEGFLVLGRSESVIAAPHLFTDVKLGYRIYSKVGDYRDASKNPFAVVTRTVRFPSIGPGSRP